MKLQLDCLLNMSKISRYLKTNQSQQKLDEEQTWTIFERAYDVYKHYSNMILIIFFSVQKD